MGDAIYLRVFERSVKIVCTDGEASDLILANYGQMLSEVGSTDLNYTIEKDTTSGIFSIESEGQKSLTARDGGDLLYSLEQDMTVQLQKLRNDLFFIHSAVLQFKGKACALVGTNKTGKSTTAWALLNHDFCYLSDELAPVDAKTFSVYPYPRALWLRHAPPGPYRLPSGKIQTSWMLCLPANCFQVSVMPAPLVAVFFVHYDSATLGPCVRTVAKASAVAQILVHALNPAAHPANGLDAAVEIATRAQCFELFTARLPETCALVRATVTAC
jgi:hypothetical protein